MHSSPKPPLLPSIIRTVDKVLRIKNGRMESIDKSIPGEGSDPETHRQQIITVTLIAKIAQTIFHLALLYRLPCIDVTEL